MASKCKHLPLSRAKKNVEKILPPALKRFALGMLESPPPQRHASVRESDRLVEKGREDIALTPKERDRMVIMSAYRLSFRTISRVYNLKPDSGMDVYRQVENRKKENPAIRRKFETIRAKTNKAGI